MRALPVLLVPMILAGVGPSPAAPGEPEPLELPPVDATPLPSEPTAAPSLDEWKGAPRFALTAASPRASDLCRAYRVREWVKIHCDAHVGAIRLLAGDPKGFAAWMPPLAMDRPPVLGGEVIFPLRPADRRVVQVFELDAGYDSYLPGSAFVIDAVWVEGERPAIRMR